MIAKKKIYRLHLIGGRLETINQGSEILEQAQKYGIFRTVALLNTDINSFAINTKTGEIISTQLDHVKIENFAENPDNLSQIHRRLDSAEEGRPLIPCVYSSDSNPVYKPSTSNDSKSDLNPRHQ